jgi:L-lactate dehydrogenase complex protein LldE
VRVQLFVTCLVDLAYPEVGERAVALLERLGCEVEFPRAQTCCGQPAHNSGHPQAAARVTRAWVDAFAPTEGPIVAPFGSCVHFVRAHAGPTGARVKDLASFVVEDLGMSDVGGEYRGRVAWHQECHLRDAGASRALLAGVRGCEVVETARPELCCGFGGTFSIKLPEVSVAMADEKLDAAMAAGVDAIVSTDPGCLMHLEGRARRRGLDLRVHHLLDLLEPDGRL